MFAGPFDARAAGRLLDVSTIAAVEVIVALVERSLVQRTGDGRFVLLDTLKHWALEQLFGGGRLASMRRRHADWALSEAQACSARLMDVHDDSPLVEVDLMLAELRSAHRFLVEEGDAAADLALCLALNDYAFFRMRPEVLAWAEDAARLGKAADHPATTEALGVAAVGAWKRGDLDQAARLAQQGIDLAIEHGDIECCLAADMMGVHGLVTGQLDEARRWLDRAADTSIARASEVRRVVIASTVVMASAYGSQPDAGQLADQLLSSLRPGPTAAGSFAWYAAAEAVAPHDPTLAMERARQALADADTTGAWFVSGVAGALIASMSARLGNVDEAIDVYRWVLPWCARAGEWSILGTALRSTSELLVQMDRHRSAAIVLGAVAQSREGHAVFGADADRLAQLSGDLSERLGRDVFDQLFAEGTRLDVDSAAAIATAEIERPR